MPSLFQNKSIRAKISNLILSSTVVIFLLTILIISITNRNKSLKDAFVLTDTYSVEYANEAKAYLEEYMNIARTISSIFEGKESYPIYKRRQVFMNILRDVLIKNPHFLATWTIWEPNAVDGLDSLCVLKPGCTHIGSFSTTYYRDNSGVKLENSGISGELFVGSYYTIPKSTKKETVLNPYFYSFTGKKKDEVLQTSMIVPIIVNQTFMGVAGIDAALNSFKDIIDKIHPFKKGYAFILANDGSFVAHPNQDFIGLPFEEYSANIEKKFSIKKKIVDGESFSFTFKNKNEKFYYSFTPIYVGESDTPWSLAVVVPYKSILSKVNRDIIISLFIGLIGILILSFILNIVSRRISKPLTEISNEMQKLNVANVKKLDELSVKEKNEIGKIAESSKSLINWINKTGEFSKEIGNGNYDNKYTLFNDNDLLGKSLLEMRDALKKASLEAKERELENTRRTWAAQGLSKINEIIRTNNNNLEKLYYNIISTLVQYVEANQGGLFLIEEEDGNKILELKASYAYDRRKFVEKKIPLNEGLLGECIMGKEKIMLSEIPESYIEIKSGLGGANPKFLLLVPLIFNEKVYGVVEIASFNEFEKHVYEFIENSSEAIASTISMIKTNVQTSVLLEKSQKQAEELESSERELQQNLEELKSVHEQMDSNNKKLEEKEKNISTIFEGIKDGIITCNENGIIEDFNPELLEFTGYSNDIKNQKITSVFKITDLENLKLDKEQSFVLNRKDKTEIKVKVKVSKIKKTDGLYYLFLIRT